MTSIASLPRTRTEKEKEKQRKERVLSSRNLILEDNGALAPRSKYLQCGASEGC